MYAFLLMLGAVITVAGLALVASGVSIQQHAFDPASITPGAIAVVGGSILVGLAFVVRALLRVERALVGRPMPRPSRPETVDAPPAVSPPAETARIPFAPKPKTVLQSQPPPPAVAAAGATPTADAAPESSRAPTPDRPENTPGAQGADISVLSKMPPRSEQESTPGKHAVAAGRTNGAAPAKNAPPPTMSARPPRRPQPAKNSIFDSLWPKAQRSAAEIQASPVPQSVPLPPGPAPPPGVPVPPSPSPHAPAMPEAAAAVSILKSGVVEGMAYTLYSDGSIEAQLPGGTLRFGSIAELRNHIEQNG